MSLKLNNQLAHLPNEINISRYEKHQRCLVLFLSWPDDKNITPELEAWLLSEYGWEPCDDM